MEGIELTSAAARNRDEIKRIQQEAGVNITDCYQCGKCSAGCPVAFAMDKTPRQIIRLLQLGMLEEALQSRTIWLCATCQTCSTRCPRDVDLAALMETVRQTAKKKGIVKEREINLFNDIFLQNLKMFGKSPEVILSALYNLRSGKLFQDVDSVPHLFLTGKAHIMPERTKDMRSVKKIFQKCLEGREHK
ncbi:4Fe-4S dicluster domain-containing protein [Candidatus Formimonas warabiya]|uniref:Heterodisulfide reductase subunit C n=1 Tax=Formimonas warabiya TaxID=1761012 RepID=A0A3G1KRK5_FORW1|nr:4Fe-4S dicluster domain-containing protein [Candidatus Formimonas warabiya]ATW25112.1 heterodisulfide reductase subunit C [Candidatus Formimonas warabiya]